MTELAPNLAAFLREHLPRDRHASRNTLESYSNAFELLVRFAAKRSNTRSCRLAIDQLTAQLILDFLDDLERVRDHTVPPNVWSGRPRWRRRSSRAGA